MGFGGSRLLDDRRRRRLVLDNERDGSADAAARGERDDVADGASSPSSAVAPNLWLSLPQVIPQKLWQVWAAGIAAAVGFVAVLMAWVIAEEASASGSMLGDITAPLTDRLLRGSGAAAWLIAGQLSCLVWWIRSRSRVDYGGRFHIWGWTSAGFTLAAMLSLTEAHRLLASVVAWSFVGSALNSAGVTATWLLPMLVTGLALWTNLGAEFRDDLASRTVHSLAAIAALALVGVELWSVQNGESAKWEFLSRLALSALQWCNLMSVWLHVRHVVHVSADPPALQASGWLLAWRYGPGRAVSWLSQRSQPTTEVTAEVEPSDEDNTDPGKKRVRVESTDGNAQEVRIDGAEPTPKGPSRRSRQAARR